MEAALGGGLDGEDVAAQRATLAEGGEGVFDVGQRDHAVDDGS